VLGVGAIAGIVLARRRSPALLALAAGTAALLAVAIARGHFDWTLGGIPTLLHQGRVWPVAHLLGAAFAGFGACLVLRFVADRSRPAAIAAATALLAVAVPSPVLASGGLTEILRTNESGFSYDAEALEEGEFVRRAAELLGPDDVVRVDGSDVLGFLLFQFSGCRLATYDDPALDGNELRIRYDELAEGWDARMAAGGFPADFEVVEAPVEGALVEGVYGGQRWALVRR
jgi:hypothetical protein